MGGGGPCVSAPCPEAKCFICWTAFFADDGGETTPVRPCPPEPARRQPARSATSGPVKLPDPSEAVPVARPGVRVKLKTGQESPITLKLTKAGTKLLTKEKALAVRVAVRGVDAAGRKDSKNVKAIFKAQLRH
jgi:hypothetical protein